MFLRFLPLVFLNLFTAYLVRTVEALYARTLSHGSTSLQRRQDTPGVLSPTTACQRWAHTSVLDEKAGLIYIYGGCLKLNESDLNQTTNLVTRTFITLDLTSNFSTSEPSFGALALPPEVGPPAVSYATFWFDSANRALVFYGGLVEDNPSPSTTVVVRPPLTLWSYDIDDESWDPINYKGDTVLRAAEGASTYFNGVGYYRGGHEDSYTVAGWSNQVPRLYLGGMLEYDMSVQTMTNVTEGFRVFGTVSSGYQDAVLVPFTLKGRNYLLNFAGGEMIGIELSMNTSYIYDIEAKKWFAQPILSLQSDEEIPPPRRASCATVAYSSDNSSINVYVYGGKSAIVIGDDTTGFAPLGEMWVLSIPAFVWIKVSITRDNGAPLERKDHTCSLVGTNMVVIGGTTSDPAAACDGSTVYVYDVSELLWKDTFDLSSQTYNVPLLISSFIGGSYSGNASWNSLPGGHTVPAIRPPDASSPMLELGTSSNSTNGMSTNGTSTDGSPTSTNTATPPTWLGAIIGGAVGGGVALVALASIAAFFILRRRRGRRMHRQSTPPLPPDQQMEIATGNYGASIWKGSPQEASELSGSPGSPTPRYSSRYGTPRGPQSPHLSELSSERDSYTNPAFDGINQISELR